MHVLSIAPAAIALVALVPAQAFTGTFPLVTPNGLPLGLEADGSGNLLFTDAGLTDVIGVVDTSGTILRSFAATASGNPVGITRDAGGRIYVTDTNGIDVDVYDAAGAHLSSFSVAGQTTMPEGITWRATSDTLFVVDGAVTGTNAVFEYDTGGRLLRTTPALNGSSLDGIAWDPTTDTFWVYDSGTDALRQYDTAFTELANAPGSRAFGLASGEGVAVIGTEVFVCCPGSDAVAVFDTARTRAEARPYGTGCPTPADLYELFGMGELDLSGTSITFTPRADGGYDATAAGTLDTGWANDLGLGDDVLVSGLPLGFPIRVAGRGPFDRIDVDSNGRAGFGLSGSDFTESVEEFLSGREGPVLAVCWDDFSPNRAGGVYFDTAPGRAVVTWRDVPQFGMPDQNTFQLQLHDDGRIVFCYVQVRDDALVGIATGESVSDPGETDLSSALPFERPAGRPIGLEAVTRPIVGTTFETRTTNVTSSALLSGLRVAVLRDDTTLPGLAAGCRILVAADVDAFLVDPATGIAGFPVPNVTGLLGATLHCQSVVLDTTVPAAVPAYLSNGLEIVVGDV